MAEHFDEIISQDFLENALQRKIKRFSISRGTKAGDNYSSTMYSIEVQFSGSTGSTINYKDLGQEIRKSAGNEDTVYLISKCYPVNSSRQEMLISMNSSYKELAFYKVYLPELIKMQQNFKLHDIIYPSYPPLVAGCAINFDEEKADRGKVYKPFDNYIMMVDVRKTLGFRLGNRLNSFDRSQVCLIMNAMARNHALSWAYKQKNNISDIQLKFPFINNDFSLKYFEKLFTDMMVKNGGIIYEIVRSVLGESSPAVKGTKTFLDAASEMLNISYGVGRSHKEYEKVMRITPEKVSSADEIPWKVVIQGDCWGNNMLFLFNDVTEEAEDVIFVDLQVVREGCPTTDLAYMFYSSTDTEFRKKHLNDMLDLYAQKFIYYCELLKTDLLPGFTAEEFKRRFHRSKLFGFCIALLGLPIFLIETEIDTEDVELVEEGKGVADMLTSLCSIKNNENASILKQRAITLVQELYDDGLI